MPDFSFIHITDHHLMESEGQTREGFTPDLALRAVFRHIAANLAAKADFIVSTGDLVEPGTDETYAFAVRLLGLTPSQHVPGPLKLNIEGLRDFPMYFLPGNHDERPLFFKYLHPNSKPAELFNYTFEHKSVRFVCIDWGAEPAAVWFPETREFLAASLQPGIPTVILSHHHVAPIGSQWLDNFIPAEIDEFWEIVTRPGLNLLGILCGHVHIPYEMEVRGIPVLGLRSTAFPFARSDDFAMTDEPPQYRVVHIKGNKLTSRVYDVPLEEK